VPYRRINQRLLAPAVRRTLSNGNQLRGLDRSATEAMLMAG
jgi:hypothetical protein